MSAPRFVDISMPISAEIVTDPPPLRPKIHYFSHKQEVAHMLPFFPGLRAEDLPEGEAWAVEELELSTHSGSHMDAPWHYHSTTDHGARRSPTIDEAPLHLFMRPGVRLDFRDRPDGYVLTPEDIKAELDRIGHRLEPFDIVLVNTAAGAAYGSPGFIDKGCGVGRAATLYLCEQGVQVVGTDAWSWDAPFKHTAEKFARDHDPSIIWEGHKAGREKPYYQMEKLQHLEDLPGYGFTVICFPVKIERAGAGWVRAVAMFNS